MSAAEAYERARRAQPGWAAAGLDERLAAVAAFRQLVDEGRDELAAILTADMGKPIAQARRELVGVLDRIDFFLDEVPRVLAPVTVRDGDGLREVVAHEPLGVVANISAWNYPWFVGANVFVPALLTGNAVLYKPSELVGGTGRAIAELLGRAGVPTDAFVLVEGGPEAGASVLDQPIDGVFFTGSYPTGRRIAEAVAVRMIAVQLELGGKDPVYVADDVEVAIAAASLADGAFYNTGQSCCSVERIYVHDSIHDRFVDELVRAVESFVIGPPTDESTYIGPVSRPQQLRLLEEQVADALAKGATVRTGGYRIESPPAPGAWFAPTVLTEVDHTMSVMRDESFGPIIGVQRVGDDDEAVALMNDTEFGLTAGVYSPDEARARAVLDRVVSGSAYWNCCDRVSPRLPWSGRRHSGVGTTLGSDGVRSFVRPRAWHLRA